MAPCSVMGHGLDERTVFFIPKAPRILKFIIAFKETTFLGAFSDLIALLRSTLKKKFQFNALEKRVCF